MNSQGEILSSIKHPAVVAARQSLGQVGRGETTSFLVDGQKLVSQALQSHIAVEGVFFLHPAEGEEAQLLREARGAGVECRLVTKGIFFKLLGLGYETSVRVLATVKRPPSADATAFIDGDVCMLVGESIQDPRNVGVLTRTADAWGLPCVVFSEDSADPYCRASVRSSTGSIFRVPVTKAAHLVQYLERFKEKGIRIIGTSAHAHLPCWHADLSGPCAMVFGNESVGLSEKARKVCDTIVSIPMYGGAHSFNVTVAAGIILYERARQKAHQPE